MKGYMRREGGIGKELLRSTRKAANYVEKLITALMI
jgi:hypothetical protein